MILFGRKVWPWERHPFYFDSLPFLHLIRNCEHGFTLTLFGRTFYTSTRGGK